MEHYTRLDRNEIVAILAQFDIHNISSFELLTGGSENTNYLVISDSGKCILCICEQKTGQEAKELADLLKYLEAYHFNTSKIIYSINKESILIWRDKPIMIRSFLEGRIERNIPPHLLKLLGKELAKLHKIPAPSYLPNQLNYGKDQFANVKNYAANSEFDTWLKQVVDYMTPYFKLNLPKSFIHSDVFWDNVIISEDECTVTIMDFEESANYFRIFDIGMTIIGICGEGKMVNLKKAKHLLDGYQSEIQLSADEIYSLKAFTIYAGASMTFWRHQNYNYVKPNPEKFNHYLSLKVLVDYLLDQADDCFVNLIKDM